MNFEYFMYQKIAHNTYGSFSKFIIRICTAAVTLSVAAMIISTCLMDGFQFEIKSKVSNFWAHIHIKPYSLTRSMGENPISADSTLLRRLKETKGVRNVQMVAYKGGIINTAEAFEGTVLRGVSREGMGELSKFIVSGSMIHAFSDTGRSNEILISRRIGDKLQLKLNQSLILSFMGNQIQRRKFVISGFFNTGIESFDNQYTIVNIEAIQKINRWSADSIHAYEVFIGEDMAQKGGESGD
ncbi:MAG: ABC transporter permease [Bacteroidetes bacterium]|nr:ABC transporter permease [Bacteroidota bacterium]